MNIRFAEDKDIPRLHELLVQVHAVHYKGRPDLFKPHTQKYTDVELQTILGDGQRPILVSVDQEDRVLGYAFCIFQQHPNDHILTDVKTLYIDDLCVDEACRGLHIGRQLYDAVLRLAKDSGCYNITLNVWSCNPSALRFYESCGLVPQKIYMEKILDK